MIALALSAQADIYGGVFIVALVAVLMATGSGPKARQ